MIPRFTNGLAASRRYVRQTPGTVYAIALLAPVLAMAAALWAGLAPSEVLRDPIVVAGGEESDIHLGLFSNLGVVLWTAAAAICLFASSELSGVANGHSRYFLLYAGVFTMLLMLDDLFMLHENAEAIFYPMYAIGFLYYMIRFFGLILRLDVVLFALAILLFGCAMLLDLAAWRLLPGQWAEVRRAIVPSEMGELAHWRRELRYLLEDGFKFVGICCWAAFHVRAAKLLRQRAA